MRSVKDLILGFNDGEDYRRRENRELFNNIFVKDNNLDALLSLNTYFLIGEKGTGKTAYAVFLANNEYKDTRSQLKYIRETEYKRFIRLKEKKQLELSDYVTIWKVILLVLVASNITASDITSRYSKNAKLNAIKDAINLYYKKAFSPEIGSIMEMVDHSDVAAEVIFQNIGKLSGGKGIKQTYSETNTQLNLLYIYRQLCLALQDLKLNFNHFLFIDGIDIRPEGIEYNEYLNCVKGLAEAVWELNNDIFAPIKDSKGRMKIVMLLRPDIFASIGMQNTMNKITNNSVYLDWRTTYPDSRNSNLFLLSEKLLSHQQKDSENYKVGEIWDHYFPWNFQSSNPDHRDLDTPFMSMLRISYSRPRDIITILLFLKDRIIQEGTDADSFSKNTFLSNEFRNKYSGYVLGGIKDQLSFYYSHKDFEALLYFLSWFKGSPRFSYEFFEEKYYIFLDYVTGPKNEDPPGFLDYPITLLQFLYDANIICYIDEFGDGEPRTYWCYRERSHSNLSPKIKTGKKYMFHNGLLKALEII